MLKKEIFSKKNISSLNNVILDNNNLKGLPRTEKKEIVNILISNMKKIYKKLDQNKINEEKSWFNLKAIQ